MFVFDFSKARKLSQKLENSMVVSDFLNGNTSVPLYPGYSTFCLQFFYFLKEVTCFTENVPVAQKTMLIQQKNIL